jgi:hypothetical protein
MCILNNSLRWVKAVTANTKTIANAQTEGSSGMEGAGVIAVVDCCIVVHTGRENKGVEYACAGSALAKLCITASTTLTAKFKDYPQRTLNWLLLQL